MSWLLQAKSSFAHRAPDRVFVGEVERRVVMRNHLGAPGERTHEVCADLAQAVEALERVLAERAK